MTNFIVLKCIQISFYLCKKYFVMIGQGTETRGMLHFNLPLSDCVIFPLKHYNNISATVVTNYSFPPSPHPHHQHRPLALHHIEPDTGGDETEWLGNTRDCQMIAETLTIITEQAMKVIRPGIRFYAG